jgi:hypothetical protein
LCFKFFWAGSPRARVACIVLVLLAVDASSVRAPLRRPSTHYSVQRVLALHVS